MKKGYILCLFIMAMLTLGFVVREVQAGNVDVYFQQPADNNGGYIGGTGSNAMKLTVTMVQTGESKTWQNVWAAQPLTIGPFSFWTGPNTRKLFRFEWNPGVMAGQVVEVWIQITNDGDLYYDLPVHNVTFLKDGVDFLNNESVKVYGMSSRQAELARMNSMDQWGGGQFYIGTVPPWKMEANIPMLDGCYTISAVWGPKECPRWNCGGGYDVIDWPPYYDDGEAVDVNGYTALCVGGREVPNKSKLF